MAGGIRVRVAVVLGAAVFGAITLSIVLVLTSDLASARPRDPATSDVRFEDGRLNEASSGSSGLQLSSAPFQDTVSYGGTYWAPDSLRWEAIRDSHWTFDTGIGSSINTGSNPYKPVGYHQTMEGWHGVDWTFLDVPYFRRSTTCVIAGSFSMWAGLTSAEAADRCWAAGQGYGNGWTASIAKTFFYPGTGNVQFSFRYACEAEPEFDYLYALIDTMDTTTIPTLSDDIHLFDGNGIASGTASMTLVRGETMRSTPGNYIIRFVAQSDGGYSDEDGLYPTTCGLGVVDDVSVAGNVSTFESGTDGWSQEHATIGIGDFSNLSDVGDLTPTSTFCSCSVADSVLVFYDTGGHHPLDQDNFAVSPWIDLRRPGNNSDFGRPGRLLAYDVYSEMPLANYVFVTLRARFYPGLCPASGQLIPSPWRGDETVYYYGEAPFCNPVNAPRLREFTSAIPAGAEQIQLGFGMTNLCYGFFDGTPCTGITNTTPWIDNTRLLIYGSPTAPAIATGTMDRLQDNFAADGTLNPASPGRIDQNRVKNASSPVPGSILGDTLVARGSGTNMEVRLVFKVRPGAFTSAGALNAMAARWTFDPVLNGRYGTDGNPATWPNWYSARMDTAQQGSAVSAGIWMSTFHEADPGFLGSDTAPDPNDPGRLANDILPDNLFTPGSRIDYFVESRYKPPDARNPGGNNWWIAPDTSGGNFREVEILPSSMSADTTWNCVLYVDHHDDREQPDQALETAGLLAAFGPGGSNADKVRHDRFDEQSSSSNQFSFGRPAGSNYGATVAQASAYRTIAWHSGGISSNQLTSVDADVLVPWLTGASSAAHAFWGSGAGLAESMNTSGGTAATFLNSVLGVTLTCTTLRNANCPSGSLIDSTYCLPTAVAAGAAFASSTVPRVRSNGCPELLGFDLLAVNPGVPMAKGQLDYMKSGVARGSASVTNSVSGAATYKTVLDGMPVGRLRANAGGWTSGCDDASAAIARALDVFAWLGSPALCPIGVPVSDVPAELPPGAPVVSALGSAWPNPVVASTRIAFTQGSGAGALRLEIFDVTGRLVRTLVDGVMPVGPHEVAWDGAAGDGHPVANGLYFYRMTARGFSESRKLLVIR